LTNSAFNQLPWGRGQLEEGVVVDAGLALAQVVREQVPDRRQAMPYRSMSCSGLCCPAKWGPIIRTVVGAAGGNARAACRSW